MTLHAWLRTASQVTILTTSISLNAMSAFVLLLN